MAITYTSDQHRAVFTRDHDLIVTAGAGSGKTRVLVDRFVEMLAAHPDWQLPSLVAITFTEKAAREMRDRVRLAIEQRIIVAVESGDGNAIRCWRDHEAALDSARIGTIHSLCATILRANAAEVEIDPAFVVLDDVEAEILRVEAIEQTLSQFEEKPGLVALLTEYDVRTVTDVIRANIAVDDGSLPVPLDYESHWRTLYQSSLTDTVAALRQDADFMAALRWNPLVAWPADDKLMAGWQLVLDYGPILLGSYSDTAQLTNALATLSNGIILKGGTARNWGGDESLAACKSSLKLIRAACDSALEQIGSFDENDVRAAEILPLWGEAIAETKTAYKLLKRRRQALDFDDLESETRKLLRREAVAQRYRSGEFRHILVDEFQDTNGAQREIITALAGVETPGSLFVVGDPRQSIYGFRGADVSGFHKEREKILSAGGQDIGISTSFRAHRPLLDMINTLFSYLMTPQGGHNSDFEVPYGEPMIAARGGQPDTRQPYLEVILIDKDHAAEGRTGADDLRQWEAAMLAQRLAEMVEGGFRVWDKQADSLRSVNYGDMAVLFQASKSMAIVEEAFKDASIPYVTLAGKGYYNRPEVWDLLNLLKAVYNPADNLALASVLRSPLFNLSDDDLLALRLQRAPAATDQDVGARLSLWSALIDTTRAVDPALPDPAQIAFARAALLRLQAAAGRVTLAELLTRALEETAYLATLSGLTDGARRVGNVEKLIELARRSGRIALGDFTLYLQDLSEREVREGEALVATLGAVQLMTVHASKGLEFPVVALFDASWDGGPHAETLLLDPEIGPACSLRDANGDRVKPFVMRLAERYAKQREDAERIRLFYVAMTRAQDCVIVSGRTNGKGLWLNGLLAGLDLPGSLDFGDEALIERDWGSCLLRIPQHEPPSAPPAAQRSGSGLSAWDRLDGTPIPNVEAVAPPLILCPPVDRQAATRTLSATEIAALGEARATGRMAKFRHQVLREAPPFIPTLVTISKTDSVPGALSSRIIGDMVHQALRWWHLPGNTVNLHDLLDSYAWEQGVTDPQMIEDAITQATDLLGRTERSKIINQIQEAGQVYRELPFTFALGTRTISGIIDVLFFSKYQRWSVVDYKTSMVHIAPEQDLSAAITAHARRYHPQLAIYAAAVEAMTGQAPEVHVHYIRYVHTVNVREETWRGVLDSLDADIAAALEE